MTTAKDTTVGLALDDLNADKLRDVAYSAGVDTEGASKKTEIVEQLRAEEVRLGEAGWAKAGEPFEVEARPRESGPSDTTALYTFKREATTDDLLALLGGSGRYRLSDPGGRNGERQGDVGRRAPCGGARRHRRRR